MGSQSHYRGVAKDNSTIIPPKNGSKTFMIKPAAMDIIWGADSRYWRLPNSEDGPVELLQVSWLEVTGSLDLKKLEAKTYNLRFTVSMRPDAFGWKGSPVYFMAKVGEGKIIWKKADLSELPANSDFKIPAELKFTVTAKDKDSTEKLRFGLYEIWRGRWKGGLVIRDVEITPA
ncbi:protein PHLOEM PROTEIN 2-LIKE A9-like protein [Cinnamomum micranthum f. kanehirae]|uniref:Protein PHLOEM PROTEIN 2-LIKE A9-like protein n=1 Tax=Cinnamomum micranthum f. kanehirae TaxID=337451 RepID=A0A3S3N016_9MAGN|nr:protein PHLOEM PROTEIN 2-LIKE A9-like protein [Cinnamomum micranthum f. kanehirae]